MSVFSKMAWVAAIGLMAIALPPCALPAQPATQATQASEAAWSQAESQRQQLESLPTAKRTAAAYQRVMDAYRMLYRDTPDDPHAAAAVAAVADLLVERGHVLHQQGPLRAALLQYEYLRKIYPHAEETHLALIEEAEICRDDLRDFDCARQKFTEEIQALPDTSFSEQATLELNDLPAAGKPAPDELASAKQAPPKLAAAKQAAARPVSGEPDVISPPAAATRLVAAQQDDADAATQPRDPGPVRITGLRHWSNPTSTRIAIDLTGKVSYEAGRVGNPDRIYFDLHGAQLAPSAHDHTTEQVDDGFLSRVRSAQYKPDVVRVVLDVNDVSDYSAFLLPNPWRLIIDVHGTATLQAAAGLAPKPHRTHDARPAKEAEPVEAIRSASSSRALPTSNDDLAQLTDEPGSTSATDGPTSAPLAQQVAAHSESAVEAPTSRKSRRGKTKNKPEPLRIVIDAGHGGHDSGTLGPGGMEEKDVVLDVALRTGRLLHKRLGAEIVYTRDDDTFVPLETRTAIANHAQADLFLSIHANSSVDDSARGVETYYLNPARSARALRVAAQEDAMNDQGVSQLSDLLRRTALAQRIEQSRLFAEDVDESLYKTLRPGNPDLKDRGPKRAPFVVLIGAQMPAVLAEISFLTNETDAEKMARESYRQRIADALATGVEHYVKQAHPTRHTQADSARQDVASDEDAGAHGR